jgi:hypothetical protein
MRRLIIAFVLLGVPTLATAQSLGELAEKEKAKKKDPKAKTFTNDDLDKHHDGEKPEPEAEASPGPSPAPGARPERVVPRTGKPVPRTEGRSGPEAGSAEAQAAAAKEPEQPGTSTSSPNASAATWRERAKQLRDAKQASERTLVAKQSELQALNLDTSPNADDLFDPNRLQKREARKGLLRDDIEKEQAHLAQLKQDIEKLQEDARQKNIPPNWLEE